MRTTLDDSKLQVAAARVLTALRRAEGLDDVDARALLEALGEAAEAWRGRAVIPRTAANLFVDLASGIEACSFAYHGQEGARIASFAREVQEAVREVLRFPLGDRARGEAVFILWHVREMQSGEEAAKLIGVYRTLRGANAARRRVEGLPGFRDHPDGFIVGRNEVGKDNWTEGFGIAEDE